VINRVLGSLGGPALPTPHRINDQVVREELRSGRYEVFHPTYYGDYFLADLKATPMVVTIHDMVHEIFPEHFSLGDSVRDFKSIQLKRANKIIAVSSATKRDLVDFYGTDPDRIQVVYHATSLPCGQLNAGTPWERYALYTGNRSGYKNFYFFLQVFAEFLRQDSQLGLVCTGPPLSASELALLERLGIGGKVEHRFADDALMTALYSHAEFFVFPSLYEGFGIPVLEAFSCGCPALLSATPALREIGSDAANYFDPKSPSGLRAALQKLIASRSLREELSQRGLVRSRDFSWAKTAEQTGAVYAEATRT
jgi:glycosyltransferase involved in cell wall biosynthesis